MSRTDIHRPSAPEFDPETYECVAFFDLHPDEGTLPAERVRIVNHYLSKGFSFAGAPHPVGQCSHCGAYLRYAALMVHLPTNGLLYIGETCLTDRFEALSGPEFRKLRTAAAEKSKATRAANARHELAAEVADWLDSFPTPVLDRLAEITYRGPVTEPGFGSLAQTDTYAGSVLSDMGRKLVQYGPLSERQVAFVCKLVAEHVVREERAARQLAEAKARQADAKPAPTGRQAVSGTVVNTWTRDSDYGMQYKMRVETSEGWVAIGTIPASLLAEVDYERKGLHGAVVSFVATFKPTDDDATVAWASRPAKARVEV